MRPIRFDEDPPLRYDNPNLRWGDPSYLLEPGDPGYVPPAPPPRPPSVPKKRPKPTTPPPTNLATMSDTFQYITWPTSTGTGTTT